ncbi:MAG: hypothetical protein V8R48_02770 [Eggerthella lenta]
MIEKHFWSSCGKERTVDSDFSMEPHEFVAWLKTSVC